MTLTITQQTMVGILQDFVRFNEREDDVDDPVSMHHLTLRIARFLSLRNDEVFVYLNGRVQAEEISREEESRLDREDLEDLPDPDADPDPENS